MAVRTEYSKIRTKTTEDQYPQGPTENRQGEWVPWINIIIIIIIIVQLQLARLVGSLLYGIRAMLVLNLPAFESKKYTAYDSFHGNGPYGEIPT